MTTQRLGKYACLEIERRYLLKTIPGNLAADGDGWLITDHYFPQTRLRLRHMQSVSGGENIYKLTQKYRTETQDADETTITNVYLTDVEYHFFKTLDAQILRKKRYTYRAEERNFSIDVFDGRHQGLILAEVEFESKSELADFVLPSFALRDVTAVPFFTGGRLVTMTDEEFRRGLLAYA